MVSFFLMFFFNGVSTDLTCCLGLDAVSKIVAEIQQLRKDLGMPKRVFTEEELKGPHALEDRTKERDDLKDRMALKKLIDPIIAEIQRLRKLMDQEPREFTEEELFGPTALKDRTAERVGKTFSVNLLLVDIQSCVFLFRII